MSRLSSPGYEQIIQRIACEMDLVAHRREHAKRKPNCFRACVKLKCHAEIISLFHSSRSGYRAQYYSSVAGGEQANRFALAVLVPRVGELLRGKEKRGCSWPWMERSLLDSTAKIWIHQGAWLRANSPRERRLFVKRWLKAQSDKDKERRKKGRWAMLTPCSEVCLELKGGFVSLLGVPAGPFKESRSRDLHELGFT
jgi:hypothetical protein